MSTEIKKKAELTDIQIIEIDHTYHWSDEMRAKVDRICTVYLYDRSVVTHCAELTPSYELIPLYYNFSTKPNQVRNDELAEEIDNEFHNEEPIYIHCNKIETFTHVVDLAMRMKNINKRFVGRKSRAYNRHIEEMVEYFKDNHIL